MYGIAAGSGYIMEDPVEGYGTSYIMEDPVEGYGGGLPMWSLAAPEVTATNGAVCVARDSEAELQMRRKFAYMVGGPAVVYAGLRMQAAPVTRLFVVGLGLACTYSKYQHYKAVESALASAP